MKKILTIIGPTASGKTSFCVALAKSMDGEVIGLDSRQIYNGMPIGTAQPTELETEGIPHHLFGFQDPSEPISAGRFAALVREKCDAILLKGKTPIICGGAGLYYRAITKGIFKGSVSDLPTRDRLEKAYDNDPVLLHNRLKEIDPEYSEIVHLNNKKRLVRALEIFEATGRPPSEHFRDQQGMDADVIPTFTFLMIHPRDFLIQRIKKRTKQMLTQGWIEEVKSLLNLQQKRQCEFPALNSIGYRQIQSYLLGKMSYESMEEDIVIRTRQYARRQMQLFRKEPIEVQIAMEGLAQSNLVKIVHDIYASIL